MCEKKNRKREVCGDAQPPNYNPGVHHSPNRTLECTRLLISTWISFDPIPAQECLDTTRNRLTTSHSCLNLHPTTSHYALRYASDRRRLLSTCHVHQPAALDVRVSTMLMNHAFHFNQPNNCI